jgi:hypothetical protein
MSISDILKSWYSNIQKKELQSLPPQRAPTPIREKEDGENDTDQNICLPPIQCLDCNGYFHNQDIKDHILTYHHAKTKINTPIVKEKMTCEYCHRRYVKHRLTLHMTKCPMKPISIEQSKEPIEQSKEPSETKIED